MQAQITVRCDSGHIDVCLQYLCQRCGWHTICIVASACLCYPSFQLERIYTIPELERIFIIPELERICVNTCIKVILLADLIVDKQCFNPFPLAENTRRGHVTLKETAWKLNGTWLVCVVHVITLAR